MANINTPIERLDLSVRAYSILKRAGKNTVGEVLSDLGSIKNLRNMTRTVYGEIYDATIQFALSQTTFEKSASKVENETEDRKRITFEGNFCEIARCLETPGGSFCEDGTCSQRRVWERLKEYEDLEEAGLLVILSPEAKQNLDSILRKENLLEEDPDAV